jgi:carbon monoxide dehydrogenase subunit G
MKLSNTIEIKATQEEVFYWLEDSGRAMKWQATVTDYEIINETPDRIGTTFTEYIEENGRGTEMRGVVTDFVSNERLAFHLEGDYNTVDVDFTLEEKGEVTLLTQNAEVNFKGMLGVLSLFFGPFIRKKIIRQTQNEFARLKELCETDN